MLVALPTEIGRPQRQRRSARSDALPAGQPDAEVSTGAGRGDQAVRRGVSPLGAAVRAAVPSGQRQLGPRVGGLEDVVGRQRLARLLMKRLPYQ